MAENAFWNTANRKANWHLEINFTDRTQDTAHGRPKRLAV